MTDNITLVDNILLRYITFLLSGFTIMCITILTNTIEDYMAAINKRYKDNGYNEPWDAEGDSDAAVLLRSQSRFEKMPAKQDPLT